MDNTGAIEPNPNNPMALALPGWAVDALAKAQLNTVEPLVEAENAGNIEETSKWQHRMDGLNDLVLSMKQEYEQQTGDYPVDNIVPFS